MAEDVPKNFNEIVNLIFFHGTGTVWNTREWRKLRHHRMVGTLIGNLTHQPHQIKENGFPILLTRNETTLLLEKGLAVLWECPHLRREPDTDMAQRCRILRTETYSQQTEILMEERRQEILDKADVIVAGKLAKRLRLDPSASCSTEAERLNIIKEETEKIPRPSEEHLYVQICTEDPWETDKKIPAQWSYPTNDAEILEYATFKGLWEKGMWVTPGGKFGGNFLAYPGDPLTFHAHYIIRTTTRERKMSPLDTIAFARLANTTRKTAVFAYFDANGEITFMSLAWAGA